MKILKKINAFVVSCLLLLCATSYGQLVVAVDDIDTTVYSAEFQIHYVKTYDDNVAFGYGKYLPDWKGEFNKEIPGTVLVLDGQTFGVSRMNIEDILDGPNYVYRRAQYGDYYVKLEKFDYESPNSIAREVQYSSGGEQSDVAYDSITWGLSFKFAFMEGFTLWLVLSLACLAGAFYLFWKMSTNRLEVGLYKILGFGLLLAGFLCFLFGQVSPIRWGNENKQIPGEQYRKYIDPVSGKLDKTALWMELYHEGRIVGTSGK